MASKDIFEAIGFLKEAGPSMLRRFVATHRGATYAELRFEASFIRSASANDGESRACSEVESAAAGLKVHYGGSGGIVGQGFTGVEVGRLALSKTKLVASLTSALNEAAARARADLRDKTAAFKLMGQLAASLKLLGAYEHSTEHGANDAVFQLDPRSLIDGQLKQTCRDASLTIRALSSEIAFNVVAAHAELRHELFINSAGAVISQGFAFSQGDCFIVAQTADGHQET